MKLKAFAISVCLLLFSLATLPALAQTTPPTPAPLPEFSEIIAAGGSWNQTGSPQFSLTVFDARHITTGLYSFSVVDIFAMPIAPDSGVPATIGKYSITTSTTSGVAQHLRDIGKVRIYVIATVGLAGGGSHVGWSYTAGGCAYIPITKSFSIIPTFRALKSSLGDVQGIYGLAVGWGK